MNSDDRGDDDGVELVLCVVKKRGRKEVECVDLGVGQSSDGRLIDADTGEVIVGIYLLSGIDERRCISTNLNVRVDRTSLSNAENRR